MTKWILTLTLLFAGCTDESTEQSQQQRLQQIHAQLQEKKDKIGAWQGISAFLGIGCVVTLIIGAAICSKARKAVKNESR